MAVKSLSLTLLALFLSFPALAQEAVFPIACNPGVSCYILSYPDLDKAEGSARDYACGPAANDGDGTLRIGLADLQSLRQGIDVLATRPGKVIDAKDGIDDLVATSKSDLKRGTPNCGNGIVIDHGGGLQSAYCHLRKDSIRVKKGDHVQAGDTIGQVGQSGVAFWPQLGFSMQSSGLFVDPISSMSDLEGCGWKQRPMIPLPDVFKEYQGATVVSMGFSPAPITTKALKLGLGVHSPVMDREQMDMNLWAMILGVRTGDRIEVRLRDPRGRTFEYRDITANADETQTPINVSRTRGYASWRQGTYTGEITLTRKVEWRDVKTTKRVQMVIQ